MLLAVDHGREGRAILRRARHLPEEDRTILELYYVSGLSRKRIGAVMGMAAGTVSRKLIRLSRRLADPLVVALVESPERELAALHRSLGIRHFLGGERIKHLAAEHGMKVEQVKEVLMYLKGWQKGKMLNAE